MGRHISEQNRGFKEQAKGVQSLDEGLIEERIGDAIRKTGESVRHKRRPGHKGRTFCQKEETSTL